MFLKQFIKVLVPLGDEMTEERKSVSPSLSLSLFCYSQYSLLKNVRFYIVIFKFTSLTFAFIVSPDYKSQVIILYNCVGSLAPSMQTTRT